MESTEARTSRMNDGTAEDGYQGEGQEEARKRQENVGKPLDHQIREPPLEARDRAEGNADHEAEADGEEADQEREPATIE